MIVDLPIAAGTSVLAIGLMSGTSQDGVDVALIDTDGEAIAQFGATACRPYTGAERTLLRRATAAAASLTDRTARPPIVAEAEALINDTHAEAVETFLAANDLAPGSVAAVGFHGQTLLHRPDRGITVQIGGGRALAARLGIAVVYDFRAADVAAGGQGAPLAPIYHRALARRLRRDGPVAVLNIGGVANVTFIDDDALIACDTGPGNALLDDFLRLRTGQPLDTDGRKAAAGAVDEVAIARLLQHPFFTLPPPKSLDRNDFRALIGDTLDGVGIEDGAATLTALTAAAVARILPHLPMLLALSANSPFWQGRDTGLASARTPIFQAFPRVGVPRAFNSYPEYVEAIDQLLRCGAFPGPTFLWWDVRLQPALGTVEIRVMDAQTTVAETLALAAFVQTIVHLELEQGYQPDRLVHADEVINENRFLAARDGMSAQFIDPAADQRVSALESLDHLLRTARPHAVDLGCEDALQQVAEMAHETGASRQRQIAKSHGIGSVASALADLFTE